MLKVEDLSVAYGGVQAVRGLSLEVRPGEIAALLGANGAGKSSTLMAIVGSVRPKGGRVIFEGRDITGTPPDRLVTQGISMIPEGARVFARQPVEQNLRLGAYTVRDERVYGERLERVYALFPRLKERRTQLAGTMSGGERQMLAIGRALMSGPRLLLIDEPSLGLSPLLVEQVFDALAALNRDDGLSVLLVEQNMAQALEVAARAYVMQSGRVVLSGEAAELAAWGCEDGGVTKPRRTHMASGADCHQKMWRKPTAAPSWLVLPAISPLAASLTLFQSTVP
jgi:branched-chain amino acid transport system ATP-binding protein